MAGGQARQARRHRVVGGPRGHRRARLRHHQARVRDRPGQLPQQDRSGLQGQRRLPGPVRRPGHAHRGLHGRGPHGRRALHAGGHRPVHRVPRHPHRERPGPRGHHPRHGAGVRRRPRGQPRRRPHQQHRRAARCSGRWRPRSPAPPRPRPASRTRRSPSSGSAPCPRTSARSTTRSGSQFLLFDNQGDIRISLRPFFPDTQHAQVIVRLPGNEDIETEGAAAQLVEDAAESFAFPNAQTVTTGRPGPAAGHQRLPPGRDAHPERHRGGDHDPDPPGLLQRAVAPAAHGA